MIGGATASGTLVAGDNAADGFSIPGEIFTNETEVSLALDVYFDGFHTDHESASNIIMSGASPSEDNLMNFGYAKSQLPGGSATLINTFYFLYDGVRYDFTGVDLSEDTWYHIALVREATKVRLFIDGAEQAPIGGIDVPVLDLTLDPSGFIFCQDQDVLGGGFQDYQCLNGQMDNLLIYNRALTPTEVTEIYSVNHESLSTDELEVSFDVSLYPNPAVDVINIELPYESMWNYSIYDHSGKMVLSGRLGEGKKHMIELADLPTNQYVIKFMDGHSVILEQTFIR